MKISKVWRTGGTWTVSIPRRYFQDKDINLGDYVKVKNQQDRIAIEKLDLQTKGRRK